MATVAAVGSDEQSRRSTASPPFTNSQSPITHFLIAALPIRNRPKFFRLNKNPISNRQKNGIFLKPATRHLLARRLLGGKPATCLPNPCPPVFWRGNYNNLKPTRCSSNRNSQELKLDVTP